MFEELFYLLYQHTGVNTLKKAWMFTIGHFGFLIHKTAFQLTVFYNVSSFAFFSSEHFCNDILIGKEIPF